MLKNILFRILFISWLVFVTFSSLFSFSGIDTSSFHIPHLDKIVHFIFYFGMVIFGVVALKEQVGQQFKLSKTLVVVFLFSVCYGIIIEVIQATYTVNRQGDILDGVANSIGALSGMLVSKILFSGKWPLK